jgi:prepilin-type N-terminal cleavage/methylation domain-containing protein
VANDAPSKGFTLIEVVIAMAVMAVAILGLLSMLANTMKIQESAREQALAMNACREVLDQMRSSGNFSELFRRYNSTTSDNAGLVGAIPGNAFDVPGLSPIPGDADNRVGRIVIPEDPTTPTILRENLSNPELGTPMDLNGDGVVDGNNHAGDYTLLPVAIVVEWKGTTGNAKIQIPTVLYPQGMKK